MYASNYDGAYGTIDFDTPQNIAKMLQKVPLIKLGFTPVSYPWRKGKAGNSQSLRAVVPSESQKELVSSLLHSKSFSVTQPVESDKAVKTGRPASARPIVKVSDVDLSAGKPRKKKIKFRREEDGTLTFMTLSKGQRKLAEQLKQVEDNEKMREQHLQKLAGLRVIDDFRDEEGVTYVYDENGHKLTEAEFAIEDEARKQRLAASRETRKLSIWNVLTTTRKRPVYEGDIVLKTKRWMKERDEKFAKVKILVCFVVAYELHYRL
jgi:hypothetical protein